MKKVLCVLFALLAIPCVAEAQPPRVVVRPVIVPVIPIVRPVVPISAFNATLQYQLYLRNLQIQRQQYYAALQILQQRQYQLLLQQAASRIPVFGY